MRDGLAKMLAEVVRLDPTKVKLSYGIKTGLKTPIFCDVKSLQADVYSREYIVRDLISRVQQYADVEGIAGVVPGVIPFSMMVADQMRLPHYSVSQGMNILRQQKILVNGEVKQGQNILLIEDVVTAGKGSVSAVKALRAEGGVVERCLTIVDYKTDTAKEAFNEIGCELDYLTSLDRILLEHLVTQQPAKNVARRIEKFIRRYIPHGEKVADLLRKLKP